KNGKWGEAVTNYFYVNNPPVTNRAVKGQYWFDALTPTASAVLVDTTTSDGNDLIFFKNLSVDVSSLSNGSHILYFRTQDKNGKWGVPMTSFFRKAAPVVQKRIAKGEYWFNSVSRPASGVTDITTVIRSNDSTVADVQNLSIVLPGTLTNGRHTVYVRFQDSNGNWGPQVAQQFVIDQSSAPPLITQMEYFFGSSDPGVGKATAPRGGTFSLTNGGRGAAYVDSFSVQSLGLPLGQTKVSARFKSDKDEWGSLTSAFFSVLTRPVLATSVTDSLRFGNLYSNRDSVTKSFYMKNNGDADLKVKLASKPSTQWSVKMYAPNDSVAKDSITILKDSFLSDSALVLVSFKPVKAGIVKNALQFTTNDSVKSVVTVPVAVTADSAVGKLAFSADSVKFGQRTVGTTTFLSVTIWNTGADTIQITTGSTLNGSYTLLQPTKLKLAPYNPNDTVKLTVKFAPAGQGTFNTSFFYVNVYNRSTQFIETKYFYITGSSIVNPNPTINPNFTSLNFGAISSRSADSKDTSLTLLLGNIGTQALSVKSIVSSDSSVFKPTYSVTLPSTVNFNGTLQVTVKFKPTANQFKTFTGNLTIRSTSLNKDSILVIPMTGDGTNGAPLGVFALADSAVDYGSVTIGYNSVRNIKISNTGGNRMLNVSSVSFSSGLFTTTQTVPFQVPPDSSRLIPVKYTPQSVGSVLASMDIQTDANSRASRSVELKGNGVITPMPLFETAMNPIAFSPTKVATPNTVYFKFKNSGNDTLRADSIFMVKKTSFFTVNRSSLKLAPNKTDSLLITFTPLAVANYSDSLVFVSNLNPPRTAILATGSGAVLAINIDTNVARINPSIVGGNQPQQIGVSLTASLGSGAVAYLYFKMAGATKYDSLLMSTADGIRYQGTIPANIISDRGAVYYVRISNGVETVSLAPNFVAVEFPFGISKGQDQPAGTKQTNYRMISVPLTMNSGSVDSVLRNFGTYDKNKWRLFRYQGGNYVEHNNASFQSFAPGLGYWFITSVPQKIRTGSGKATSASSVFTIDLQNEWNQIGNPYNFSVLWDSVTGKGVNVGQLFDYNGVDFVQVNVMQPWVGYFVKNASVNPVTIGIRPVEPGTPSALPKISPEGTSALADGEWMLKLKASAGDVEDQFNYLGVKKDASEGYDRNDIEESPKQPGEFLKLRFDHRDWNDRPDQYGADFRPLTESGRYWDLELNTNSTAENITLTADQFQSVPEHFNIVLVDADAHTALDLRKTNTLTIPSSKKEMTKQYRIVIGTEEFVQKNNFGISTVPMEFALSQNYPNPFNPSTTIRYALPKAAAVRITVFDILGKEVTTLVNETKGEGYQFAQWHAVNRNGMPVSSGVYFCRIDARSIDGTKNFVQTIKMVLMK
ncbi:MAG: choice-of-anchor D domain-containing protein, partial [Bacteroidota bacterium]